MEFKKFLCSLTNGNLLFTLSLHRDFVNKTALKFQDKSFQFWDQDKKVLEMHPSSTRVGLASIASYSSLFIAQTDYTQ